MSKINIGNLYDANKQLMAKQSPMSAIQQAAAQKKLEDWFNMSVDCYAMLLCHERRDYTIFHMYENPPANPNPPTIAAKECMICLTNRGAILSIDKTQDNAWEIWIKVDDEAFCYYLFCYDNAVIEC